MDLSEEANNAAESIQYLYTSAGAQENARRKRAAAIRIQEAINIAVEKSTNKRRRNGRM